MEIDTPTTMDQDKEEDVIINTSSHIHQSTIATNPAKHEQSTEMSNHNDNIDNNGVMNDENENKDDKADEDVVLSIKSMPELQVLCWREEQYGMFSI